MSGEGVRRERPTLSDVAERAGTSIPTVSKVLRGGTDVSPATRDRVMEAVRAVGYARAARATAGESDAPAMIDLVVNHVHGTWANGVLTGVESAATAANVDVVITVARDDGNWVSRLLRRPSHGAIVVLVDPAPAHFAALEAARIPVVLVTPMSEPSAPAMRVGVTNWDGGRTAAEHLLGLGHERFAVVGGDRAHLYSRARIDGFRSALEVQGGRPPVIVHGDWDRGSAAAAIAPVLAGPDRPTAVFACSDLMAMGVYDAARAAGLRVPEDLSVVGFDDVPEASWGSPPLTTVRQPITEMGEAAVRLLLSADAAADPAPAELPRVDLSTSLVVRASTRRVAG
ncbi:substrate-binding domain-containing protein [Leifsonia shinshuensis]|uniref:LacI family DNA-binding transcriptional regulator n=1 Tax=Leifsonia shinshuensis TaxID=150026 RepID=UPI001F50A0B9|nr:substrate-binding domain-containing protein [Leifsonia shinshuensis]MCI0157670.1 substrate-binding domain-containing protein [Leifsonia shinshuensis]